MTPWPLTSESTDPCVQILGASLRRISGWREDQVSLVDKAPAGAVQTLRDLAASAPGALFWRTPQGNQQKHRRAEAKRGDPGGKRLMGEGALLLGFLCFLSWGTSESPGGLGHHGAPSAFFSEVKP